MKSFPFRKFLAELLHRLVQPDSFQDGLAEFPVHALTIGNIPDDGDDTAGRRAQAGID